MHNPNQPPRIGDTIMAFGCLLMLIPLIIVGVILIIAVIFGTLGSL